MKTTLDAGTRDELVGRIFSLREGSAASWGKMNLYQMLRHCVLSEEMYLGKTSYPRVAAGYLFGKPAQRSLLKDEKPMPRNARTLAAFRVAGNGHVEMEKEKWASLVREYECFSLPYITHWFFGKMTKEEVGYFAFKHADHHLRQFNA